MNSKKAGTTVDRMMDLLGEGNFPDQIERDNSTLGIIKNTNKDINDKKPIDNKTIKKELTEANVMCKQLVGAIRHVFTCTTSEEIEAIPELEYIRSRSALDSDALTLLCSQIENTVNASNTLVDSINCVEVDPKLYGMLSNLNKSLIELLRYRSQLIMDLKDEYENIMSDVAARTTTSKKKSSSDPINNQNVPAVVQTTTLTEQNTSDIEKVEAEKEEADNQLDTAVNPPASTLSIPEDYKVDTTDYSTKLNDNNINNVSDELEGVVFSNAKELMALIPDEHIN